MMTALVTDKEIQSDSKSETEFLLKEDNEDNVVDNLEYPLSNSSAYSIGPIRPFKVPKLYFSCKKIY